MMSEIIKEKINRLKSEEDLKEMCLFLFDEFEKLLRIFKNVEVSFLSLNDFVKQIDKFDDDWKEQLSRIIKKLSIIENAINEFWFKDKNPDASIKSNKKDNEVDNKKFS